MRISAAMMAAVGVCATFLPMEILVYAGIQPVSLNVVVLQVSGALYLGFAILNWLAQANLIGGIYGRPIAMGNFCHFVVAALALAKVAISGEHNAITIVASTIYAMFAALFALVVFRNPLPAK